jgi:hypothetical protein
MNRTERQDAYEAGTTISTIEYGVLYPNGNRDWSARFERIDTPAERAQFQKDWLARQESMNLPPLPVRFLSRISTTEFTEPVEIDDNPKPWDAAKEGEYWVLVLDGWWSERLCKRTPAGWVHEGKKHQRINPASIISARMIWPVSAVVGSTPEGQKDA